ncbi:MAG: tyrosine-type recombinase/integrase [Ignavibacteriales bacterium]
MLYAFTTPEGEAYTSESAWKRAFYTALKKSGIGKCRFHDLRHTFCSNLIVGEKEDLVTVMELTGHKDMRILKRYSHTRESAKKRAIDKLGGGLNLEVMDTSLDTTPKTTTPIVANLSVVTVGK